MHDRGFIDGAGISVYQRLSPRMLGEWAAGVVLLPHYLNRL